MTQDVQEFISNWHSKGLKLKAIQDEFINAKKPLPSRIALQNEISKLRAKVTHQSTIKLSELHQLLKANLPVPEDEFKAFVLDYKIMDKDDIRFDFVISSKKLLELNTKSKVCNADTTYKLIWQGYPVQVTGHTDYNKKFHPTSISVSTNEDEETYTFLFDALKRSTKNILGKELSPTALVCDAAKAISNGFRSVFGNDFVELMCWFHAKRAMKDNISHIIPAARHVEVLNDIDRLQLAQNPAMFDKASLLFIEKYAEFPDFVGYFTDQWLKLHRNWYEGACVDHHIKAPSCNNGLEVFNRTIKDEKTFRQRLPLQQFFDLMLTSIESWGRRYHGGASIYNENVVIDLETETKAYQWVKEKKFENILHPIFIWCQRNHLLTWSIGQNVSHMKHSMNTPKIHPKVI